VRLFRSGQLVGYTTPADKLVALAKTGTQTLTEELNAWRQANKIELDASGHTLLTFNNVKVPQRAEKSQLVFSAYAFNEDRVKSLTDRFTYELPAAAQPRKGRAYIVSVGVSAFENSTFNLDFADNDAKEMQSAITKDLAATGQFSEIIPIMLTSNYKRQGAETIITEKSATKANLQKVLARLSNRSQQAAATTAPPIAPPAPTPNVVKPAPRGKRPEPKANNAGTPAPKVETNAPSPAGGSTIRNFDKLAAATPDDLVLILYSSHGYADRAGNFYLIPYDTGPGNKKAFTETVRQHSISSEELSLWLRDVDAGEMVLIVDACHSTAAVEGHEFKPGPMGARGLGQLSYDKGMRILTATQADNVALENKAIRHGFLSYALTIDGLESQHADFKPQDKTITLLEWLEYGELRVPKLDEEIKSGRLSVSLGERSLDEVTPTPRADEKPSGGATTTDAGGGKFQQPSLFDFARGRRNLVLRNPDGKERL
jgi:hypothetical protein